MRVCFSKHNRRATRSIYAFICLIKLWPKRDLANKKLLIRDSNMLQMSICMLAVRGSLILCSDVRVTHTNSRVISMYHDLEQSTHSALLSVTRDKHFYYF
jgi:hypothetical protein